jgi:WXXGXW repeat (2 copies)
MRRLLIALSFAALASTMAARADVENAVVSRAMSPPAAQSENVPAARKGYAWSPGFWDWRGTRYVWMKGEWVREKPGYRWEGWHWVGEAGRWYFVQGRYTPVSAATAVLAQR